MAYIGFEWVVQQTLSVLPGSSFSMSIIWEHRKIPSSIGKDTYLDDTLLLPNTIISATGRIHHDNRQLQHQWENFHSKVCHPVICPSKPPTTLQLEIIVPPTFQVAGVDRVTFVHFVKKNRETIKVPLYPDPQAIRKIGSSQLQIDLTPIILKHLLSH